jgi:hypothetical protein
LYINDIIKLKNKLEIMNRIHIHFIKWLSNKFGYKIVMLKSETATTTIEGDKELLKYVDVSGFFFKKEPLSRKKQSNQNICSCKN